MLVRRRLLRAVGVLVLLAAVAACGSTSPHGSANTSAPTAKSGTNAGSAASSATGTPIKIGAICSCTGTLGIYSVAAGDVIHAWAKSVNASGGLSGHPVALIYFDDGASPGTAATDAQTLVSDHVAAVVDLSLLDPAWASIMASAKIPVIGGEEQSQEYLTNPDFYSTTQTADSFVYSIVAIAKEAGATSIGTVVCAESPACAIEIPAVKTYGARLGVPQVYATSVSATAPNYTAQCLAAEQAKAKAFFVSVAPTTAATIAEDCGRQGYHPIYVADSSTYVASDDSAAIGKDFWSEFQNLPYWYNTPAVQDFDGAVDRYYPGIRQGKGGVIWTEFAAQAWTNGLLIRDAVKSSGAGASDTVSAAAMTQGLHALKNDTLDGWSSPLTYTAGKPTLVDCWFTVKVVNGVRTVLDNGKPTCHRGAAS